MPCDPKNKRPKTQRIGEGLAGPGRKKGVPNKLTADVKSMILEALSNAGGAEYLTAQAALNPSAFLTLVGKVLPMTVAGDVNEPLVIKVVRYAAEDIEPAPAPITIDLTPEPTNVYTQDMLDRADREAQRISKRVAGADPEYDAIQAEKAQKPARSRASG